MKLLSMVFVAAAVLVTATDGAQAYYRWPFYDAAYIGSRLHLGYRGYPYSLGGPAFAWGDPAYGGCRRGYELVPTAWGPRRARVRLCPAGSGIYRSRYWY
jgi:hypothetical protein